MNSLPALEPKQSTTPANAGVVSFPADDITYTYDVRGNRTDIDISGSGTPDNTDLTFNIADQLTRVDNEDNSYKVFTYDDNGNCTKEEFYSGTYLMSKVVIPLDPNQTKQELLKENEEHQAKRVHYPFAHAPKELARTRYLSPYLPETTDEDFYLNSMLEWTNPELANLKRKQKWIPHQVRNDGRSVRNDGINPYSVNPADETTDYEYDQANRLTKATLPSGVEIEFEYDGIGRRLKKIISDDTGSGSEDVVVTTTKYHYIGGQLTTIEIDEETTDDSDPPVSTATKDETIHIHLGPNSQPISFEWVRYDYTEEETLDDTYWFHYDIHGNTIKITDEDGDVVVRYEYDVLGELVEEYNPDSIPNPFKWGGVSQLIHDEEIDMYTNKAGSYDPEIGTLLGGGAPVFTNPTSENILRKMAMRNLSSEQTRLIKFYNLAFSTNLGDDNGGIPKLMAAGLIISIVSLILAIFYDGEIRDLWRAWMDARRWEAQVLDQHKNLSGLTGVDINSYQLANLINKQGDLTDKNGRKRYLNEGSYISAEEYKKIRLKLYGGGFIRAYDYIKALTEDSLYAAEAFTSNDGVTIVTNQGNKNVDLAADIFDAACAFDAKYGADAHRSPEMRKKWKDYLKRYLRGCRKNKRRKYLIDDSKFDEAFEAIYGSIPSVTMFDVSNGWLTRNLIGETKIKFQENSSDPADAQKGLSDYLGGIDPNLKYTREDQNGNGVPDVDEGLRDQDGDGIIDKEDDDYIPIPGLPPQIPLPFSGVSTPMR